jgi:hypothetical protein
LGVGGTLAKGILTMKAKRSVSEKSTLDSAPISGLKAPNQKTANQSKREETP